MVAIICAALQMGPGVPVRVPIFISNVTENETFGYTFSAEPYCKGQCYRPQLRCAVHFSII